jgi:hypothetical protein
MIQSSVTNTNILSTLGSHAPGFLDPAVLDWADDLTMTESISVVILQTPVMSITDSGGPINYSLMAKTNGNIVFWPDI